MERIALFVNDAAHARHLLQPMLAPGVAAHWIVVACPPTLTRHAGRWVSRQARRAWRERWADELVAQIAPKMRAAPGSQVDTQLASRPLLEVSASLQRRWPGVRLFDARCPALGRQDEPITAAQPPASAERWAGGVLAAGGLTAVLTLVD